MTKRFRNITNHLSAWILILLLLALWQVVCATGLMPPYLLPSPLQVARAFADDFPALMQNAGTTLGEAFLGLGIGVALAFLCAFLMDRSPILYRSVYPLLVITQTVPTVALAPLLVLWMGYGLAPKVTLVVIVCFFPITVALLDGFRAVDPDVVNLMRAMGAGKGQIFRYVKLPSAMPPFFSGLRVAVSYSVVGAVIAEWIGGFSGLGVYMTRVRKSFAFDKMFAVILLVSVISLALMKAVTLLRRACMPWDTPTGKS